MNMPTKHDLSLSSVLRKTSSVLAFLAFAAAARADINLVTNGNFESTTNGFGQLNGTITSLTDWTNAGYNFVMNAGNAATGVTSEYGTGDVGLWTSAGTCPLCDYRSDPVAPGPDLITPSPITPSPAPNGGGNFVAGDGAFQVGALTQQINGLIVGHSYTVGFYYAGAQQTGYDGPTQEGWIVGLGSSTQPTPLLTDPSHGFTGWYHESFNFTASSTSELLSFLPVGLPNESVPPFSLLDGVTLEQTPEPGYWIPGVGLLCLMAVMGVIRSRKTVKA
jgi:hypothetical protein